jgi:hypothetical protein
LVQPGGSRVWEREGKRRGSAGLLIGAGVWRIEQQIDGIEGGEKIALGLAHRREIRLEVRGDDLARQLGPACQWKGEKREGTGSVLIAGLRAGYTVGPKGMPRGPLLFFSSFLFFLFLDYFISFSFVLQFDSNQFVKFSKIEDNIPEQ